MPPAALKTVTPAVVLLSNKGDVAEGADAGAARGERAPPMTAA
eukprot:gene1790-7005_t